MPFFLPKKLKKIVRDFTYLTHISQSFHIVTCTNDSWQVNMITKEFKCVVVLVILGDIVAKKRIFIGKKIFIASLRGNLLSNHCSRI